MSVDVTPARADGAARLSLATAAARNLATTTKSEPQMRGISPRWLLRMLPWVQVGAGTYRVNRRVVHAVGRGRVSFAGSGADLRVAAPSLREVPVLRGVADDSLLAQLAGRFTRREVQPGEVLAEAGRPIEEILVIAHGKVGRRGVGRYGQATSLGVLAEGDHLGDEALARPDATWAYTATALGHPVTLLVLPRPAFAELAERSEPMREQIARHLAGARRPVNRKGEADIALAAGHAGEPELPGTFVDYEPAPREYELSVAQTVLRVHSRVSDLFNDPMNQVEQQLRLTIEAVRERQEHELVNNREFGLLHNAAVEQRFPTRVGPPTPDDLDELLTRRRGTRLFLAHPRAIAAFGRECSGRGVHPDSLDIEGRPVSAWRGVPIFPCDKIPITGGQVSSILAMRTGENDEGVIGLHRTGIPDEYEPGLSVRYMGITAQAVISYLVSAYYSVAVLVPDALGVLENVEVSQVKEG